FIDGKVFVHAEEVGHVADDAADLAAMLETIKAADRRTALIGPHQAGEDLHGGALAGAVGADEAEDLASADLEGEVIDGGEGSEALGDVAEDEHGLLVYREFVGGSS